MPDDRSTSPSGSIPPASRPDAPTPPATPRHESRWPFLLEMLLVVLALAWLAAYTIGPRLKLQRQYAGRKTMVAMWAVIAERPIADDILKQGSVIGSAPAKGFQTVRIDTAALFKILHDPLPDHKVACCAPTLGWLQESNRGAFLASPDINYRHYMRISKTIDQDTDISVNPEYQFVSRLPEARLTFKAYTEGSLSQNHIGGDGERVSFALKRMSFDFNDSLMPGESVVSLAAMAPASSTSRGGVPGDPGFVREPFQLVILQAINAHLDLSSRLAAFSDANRWLREGLDGALEAARRGQSWEARASSVGPKGGIISTTAGPYRILGISQPSHWPGCWWDAEGNPIQAAPVWSQEESDGLLAVVLQSPSGLEGRISLDLKLDLGGARNTSSNSTRSSSAFGHNVVILSFSDMGAGLSKETQAALERGTPLTLAITQATGPWEELGRIREGETKEYAGGRFTIKKVKPRRVSPPDVSDRVLVEGDYTFDPAFEIALLGVAKDGRRSKFSDRRNEKWFPYVSVGMKQGEIESFAIMRRPLTTATLNAIASRPRILPDTLLPPRRAEATTMTLTHETPTSSPATRVDRTSATQKLP